MSKTKRIRKKEYYRIGFTLTAPLSIGSRDNNNTDRDLILNSRNKPYIPGAAIAGVVRHALAELYDCDPEMIEDALGNVKIATAADADVEQLESRIIFYDANMESDSAVHKSVRDSVALDDFKTAKKSAKFDMEVLEAGARFCTFIEHNIYEGDPDPGSQIPAVFADGRITFGGKSMRGYGTIGNVKIGKRIFDLTDSTDLKNWLGFDLYTETNWEAFEDAAERTPDQCVRLSLKQKGAISIRRYTTAVRKDKNDVQPDFEQLTAHKFEGQNTDQADKKTARVPVIPGTSWAGAFRHRMKEFGVDVSSEQSIFGYVSGDSEGTKKRSQICFSESRLRNAKEKVLSRNAIDRFSGGTKDGALFTEKTYYGGNTDLVISWRGKGQMKESEKQALAAAIADLHYGLLAVGGATSIGRGLFTIEKINDKPVNDETVFQIALNEIGSWKQRS